MLDSTRTSSMVAAPTQLVTRFLGFVTTIVLARALTVGEFGIYNLLMGATALFTLFTSCGLADSLQRFVPEYLRARQYGRLLKTFFFSQVFRAASGVVLVALLIGLFDFYAPSLKLEDFRLAFILFCVSYWVFGQVDHLRTTYWGLMMQPYAAIGDAAHHAIRLVITVVLLFGLGGAITSVFVSELIAAVIICITMWLIFIFKVYRPLKPLVEGHSTIERRRVARFSLLSASAIPGAFIFGYGLDYLVVGAMAATDDLGVYSLASRAITMMLVFSPQILLANVMRPVFYQRYYAAEDKRTELNRMFNSIAVLIAAVVLPLLALVGVQAERLLVLVFGSDFALSAPIFLVLAGFQIFVVVERPSDLALQAVEKVQARLYAQIFAVYNVVAAILLMRAIGLMGVALATGSAYMAKCVMWYLMARHWAEVRVRWAPLAKIAVNTVVAGGVAYGVGRVGGSAWWAVASVIAGVAVYIGMARVNGFLDDSEKALVNRFVKRRVFRV